MFNAFILIVLAIPFEREDFFALEKFLNDVFIVFDFLLSS